MFDSFSELINLIINLRNKNLYINVAPVEGNFLRCDQKYQTLSCLMVYTDKKASPSPSRVELSTISDEKRHNDLCCSRSITAILSFYCIVYVFKGKR